MQRKKPFTPEQFKHIYSQVPRITVEAVIHSDEGVLLAVRQEDSWKDLWHIPGGTVFYDETLVSAVERIAAEETGGTVIVEKMLTYLEYPSERKERGFGWTIGIAFLCQLKQPLTPELIKRNQLQFFKHLPENMVEEQRGLLKSVLSNDLSRSV